MLTVVTGANGFIGSRLVRALVEGERCVRCLTMGDARPLDGLDVEIVPVDVRDPSELDRAIAGAGIVYHLAAVISITGGRRGAVREVNVHGTRNAVDACLRFGVRRLVYFSSVHAFDLADHSRPLSECSPLAGRGSSAYDRSKALGFMEVTKGAERGLDVVTVHPSGVIGPGDHRPSLMGRALLQMFRGRLPAVVTGGFDWVDVRDVVAGAMLAEKAGRAGENYILSGEFVSCRDIAALAAEIGGGSGPRLAIPRWLAAGGVPIAALHGKLTGSEPLLTLDGLKSLGANPRMPHEKASRNLGYQSRPIRETLQATHDWFRAAGYLDGSSLPSDARA